MRRAAPLLTVGLIGFAILAIAALPARMIFDMAAAPSGARAGLVQGTVWDAQVLRLNVGGAPIAQIRAALRPASLLGGAARFEVAVRDDSLRGEGEVILSPGGAAIEAATGVIGLSRFALAAGLPPGQSARVEIDRIAVDRQGRCLEAQGRVTTAALVAAGDSFDAVLPMLSGAFFCAGDQLAVQLDGATEALSLSGRLRFEPAAPAWRIEARTADRDVVAALSVLGFVQEGAGLFVLDSARAEGEV